MASSTLIIEEQTGQKRTLTLVGSGLPKQGASWEDEMVVPTTWNPGNVEATSQVLGPRLGDSAWEFEWRTVRLTRTPALLNGQPIDRATTLYEVVRSITRSGMLARVSWIAGAQGDVPGAVVTRVVRLGRCVKLTPKFITSDDIEVSMTWTWSSDGARQAKASDLRGNGDLSARLAAVRSSDAVAKQILEAQLRRRVTSIPGSADTFTLGQLEQLVAAPLKLVDDMARAANGISASVSQLGGVILKVRALPSAIAGRALDVANNAVGVANNFIDAMSRVPPETMSARSKVSSLTRAVTYYGGAVKQSDLMTGAYLDLTQQARARRSALVPSAGDSRRGDRMQNADNYEIYIPKTGDTYASIALKFYENADLGDELAVANGRPSYEISPPRTPLIIPTRRSLEDQDRNKI